MRWDRHLVVLVALAAGPATAPSAPLVEASAARPPGTMAVRWTAAVPLAAADWPNVQSVLDRPVDIRTGDPLTLVKGDDERSPRTGAEYLKLRDAGYEYKSNYDNMKESWFMAATLPPRWVSQCRPPRVSHLRGLDLSADPKRALALLPADLGVDLTDEHAGQPWLAAWPKSTASAVGGKREVEIDDGEGGRTVVEVVAWGDRDGDGVDDCLLSIANRATEGTFKAYRYVTATRGADDRPLSIMNDKP